MSPLVFFPLPKDQESAMSLIYRCAIGNGISTKQLLLDAHMHYHRCTTFSRLLQTHAICNLLTSHPLFDQHEKARIKACFYTTTQRSSINEIEVGGVFFASTVLRTDRALCPGCARDGVLNQMHSFNFSDICPVHGESYIETCPKCENKLEWRSINNYFCPCGFDLRLTPTMILNKNMSQLLSTAFNQKDVQFFSLFASAMTAMRFAHTHENRKSILESCTRIATGNRTFFFREVEKLQERFPSLHRRALLAPFLLSTNSMLSQYAKEYYFSASQTRPESHAANCRCGELVFEAQEMKLIFGTYENFLALRSDRRCVGSSTRYSVRKTFQCPQLCKTIYTHKYIEWERDDIPAEPLPEFKLLNHIAAAELLGTNPSTVRRLIKSGLLKGAKLDSSSRLSTTLKLVQEFNVKYILRSEITRKSGLLNNELRTLLLNLAPIAIQTTRYGKNLLIYQRKQLPEILRHRLDQRNMQLFKAPPPPKGMMTFNIVSEHLNMPVRDVYALVKLGILESVTGPILRANKKPRQYCTIEGLDKALNWRKEHLSVSEFDEITGCDSRIIHSRYIETGFIQSINLDRAYITLENARRIYAHYSTYITLITLCAKFRVSKPVIVALIDAGKIRPLPPDHPDAINGHTIIRLDESNNALNGRNKIPRTTRRRHTIKPIRKIYNHYLTSSETLRAIAESIGIEPIKKFDKNNNPPLTTS